MPPFTAEELKARLEFILRCVERDALVQAEALISELKEDLDRRGTL